jgi:hypothetical protein
LGDCCLTSANEEKTVNPAITCAEICAHNIKMIDMNKQHKMKKIPKTFPFSFNITLGRNFGIKIFNNYTTVSKRNAKDKIEM